MRRFRCYLSAFLIFSLLTPRSGAGDADKDRPRLVVLLVFDQMRGDYPQRWQAQFGDKGFKRLAKEGAWFTNCHYPYAYTVTAAGHASLVTGCSPNKHGIIGNEWYDRETKGIVTAIGNEKYRQLPEPDVDLPKDVKTLGVAPDKRLQPSVADALREATKGKSKIVSLSIKPRSASLMAALLADLVYWFSEWTGGFCTSSFYREAPHDWVERFNAKKPADHWFEKEWDRFRPSLDYSKLAGPDDAKGEESKALGLGRTFPHPLTGSKKMINASYYNAIEATPMGNELLYRFALEAIEREKLGKHEAPDLLMVSFSSNDLCGHLYGPDSQEVFDMTLRTDALIGDFLEHLDRAVGKGRYAVVVSADHGICPLPEVARKRGKEADRLTNKALGLKTEAFLQKTFGPSERYFVEAFYSPWVYLDRRTLAELKIAPADAERKLADFLAKERGMEAAFTRTELMKGMPKDKIGAMVWRSYYPDRSGDVVFVTKPYFFVSSYEAGTTHGSPWDYDTHVPLFAFGPGIRTGRFDEAVTPQAAAAILSHFLGVSRPSGAEAELPKALRGK
ncbi:MAG: alkaline phosphatase family protein [Gemmataceae bacterium]